MLLLVLAACSSGDPTPPATSGGPTSATPTVTATVTASVTESPASPTPTVEPVILPPGVPATYRRDDDQANLPLERLVPPGVEITGTWFPDRETLIVTWGAGDDPFRREQGVVVWRRTGSDPPWVATYAFLDPPKAGVLGVQVDTGDVTGDGHPDALVFENTGGSGVCGTWSVIALSPEGDGPTYTKDLCDASVEMSTRPVGLRLVESIFGPTDPHCCPSGVRTSILQWNGSRWRVTSREETGA